MANPDISLLGATYSGVAGVTLPKNGGGTATFPWVEGSQTVTTNATYDVTNLAQLIVNVSGGGGGASNVVTGTFTASATTGAAQTVNIPYTGSSHPIFIAVYPNDGYATGSSLYNVTQQYAVICFAVFRANISSDPSYNSTGSGTNNSTYGYCLNKSSSATGTSGARLTAAATFTSAAATAAQATCVRMSSNKTMSIFVASNSYGFRASTTYRYVIVYSS